MCPSCAVAEHRIHDVFLMDAIVDEERKMVRQLVDQLTLQMEEWMESNGMQRQEVMQEMVRVKERSEQLKGDVCKMFEGIRVMVERRREVLLKEIDGQCEKSMGLLEQLLSIEEETRNVAKVFENVNNMDSYELLLQKTRSYGECEKKFKNVTTACEKVDVCKLHEMSVDGLNGEKIEDELKNVGQLVVKDTKTPRMPSQLKFSSSGTNCLDFIGDNTGWKLFKITQATSFKVKVEQFTKKDNYYGLIIGFVSETHVDNRNIGYNKQGAGMTFLTGQVNHGATNTYTQPLSVGDIVEARMEGGSLSFAINGVDKGIAFKGIGQLNIPAVSLACKQAKLVLLD